MTDSQLSPKMAACWLALARQINERRPLKALGRLPTSGKPAKPGLRGTLQTTVGKQTVL
jgi:hypothetical protein